MAVGLCFVCRARTAPSIFAARGKGIVMNQKKLLLGILFLSAAGVFAQPAPPQPQPFPDKYFQSAGPSSFLGVGVVEVDTDRAKELKLKEESGVEVKSVAEESPASKAGVKVGD